ncbi:MAG: 2Fe-2S iron-sulfur cluster binding domain-containing protein [Desulfurococcales archaeon]|jgi:carbon-monoxide dehydrogenase small subunit|uniref:(2Fe-2S)-binding protein n=1 Tax=Fervidicoccus fontis TaxID=683846 RepID=A0A7J3SPL7_9CREN|nr:(2Fe-2S)-binding protein [Thermoprotei archaeon]NAY89177.1 2Fe-2S iron-sulfur cluster binding domain-containing protein [Desulfurococcales archaeon]
MTRTITFKLNGRPRVVEVEDNETLLEVLRNKLGELSVKAACYKGECGLCTVLFNGRPVKSCMVLAVEADGGDVVTAAGIASNGELVPVQKSFIEHGAFQCGFCTPAFVVASHYFLQKNPNPTREEVKEFLSGILCRCTGYKQIVDAILDAAKYYRK